MKSSDCSIIVDETSLLPTGSFLDAEGGSQNATLAVLVRVVLLINVL